ISKRDWSSDVCSSDLVLPLTERFVTPPRIPVSDVVIGVGLSSVVPAAQGREVAAAGRATLPVLFPRDRVIAVGVASLSVAPRESASAVTESNVLLNPFGNFVRINVLVLSEIEHWPEDRLRPGHRPRTSEPALDRAGSEHGSRGNPIALDADRRKPVAVLTAPRVA